MLCAYLWVEIRIGSLVSQRNTGGHDFFHFFNHQFDVFHNFFSFVSEVIETAKMGNGSEQSKSQAKVATVLSGLCYMFIIS